MPPLRASLALLLVACLASACAKVQARIEPTPPVELLPPPPPPRLVEHYPDEVELPAAPTSSEAFVSEPPAITVARPAIPRPDSTVKPEPAKPEGPVPAPTPAPAVTLKPAPGSQSATEASIRDLLGRANRDLQRVNYQSLSVDGKAQYDTARRFVQQSEDALRNGNLVFAGKLADKAATMAAVLVRFSSG